MTDATNYPVEMASAIAAKLAQQIEDGTLSVKHVVIFQEDDENLYALQITYKRTRGLSC